MNRKAIAALFSVALILLEVAWWLVTFWKPHDIVFHLSVPRQVAEMLIEHGWAK